MQIFISIATNNMAAHIITNNNRRQHNNTKIALRSEAFIWEGVGNDQLRQL